MGAIFGVARIVMMTLGGAAALNWIRGIFAGRDRSEAWHPPLALPEDGGLFSCWQYVLLAFVAGFFWANRKRTRTK